jgi:hypothetical protein
VVHDERDDGAVINFGSSVTLFFQGVQTVHSLLQDELLFLENKGAL